ncbi:unnamed protein product [Linum tenue]|uniref:O-methyltransferase dimerisation domain-containing protein n=1 Tax=Linum tenue TaxID=586396 RepID=A0AAV0KJ41_9ROSI|nr:unnamed protein product [Linum tenue]
MDSETAIQLLEAQRQVWDHSYAYIKTMAVQSAMELDIPGVVQSHGKPITVRELGSAPKIAPARIPFLARLMRMLAHMGYFVENLKDGDDETATSYSATLMCGFLVKDSPFNAATWFLLANDPIAVDPWRSFGAWIRQPPAAAGVGDFPFTHAHNGKKLYEVCRDVPRIAKMMNEGIGRDISGCSARPCWPSVGPTSTVSSRSWT